MTLTIEELEDYFQFVISIVGTQGAKSTKYKLYKKKELLQRLENLLPDGDFKYSILVSQEKKDKGI
jgi:hypothetical protein